MACSLTHSQSTNSSITRAKWAGDREIVTADAGRVTAVLGYAALRERSNRLSGALAAIGLKLRRLASARWRGIRSTIWKCTTPTMGAGLVCHTLNPRVSAAHLAPWSTKRRTARSPWPSSLTQLLDGCSPRCPSAGAHHPARRRGAGRAGAHIGAKVWTQEALLEDARRTGGMGRVRREHAGRALLHVRHHRQSEGRALHASLQLPAHAARAAGRSLAVTRDDVVLVAVPMFHANGWGLPSPRRPSAQSLFCLAATPMAQAWPRSSAMKA